ncbi:aldehyde-activating protein [Altererythrobacter sp. KTW20L]|uniref:GFA family protein n=1 Tax=Altererythrobacter sp. KTW20L TaxID=2942210 RepID=UPI0020C18904|nr:aldehyde-activating protein [Altererythrobacter sp. KTW20L]MCL6250546.1 aldehyde-activating protein [Altererythrobacter sp. KTW20L]
MTSITCLCGQVRIETARLPDYLNDCNCALCRKSGARWGYFAPADVTVEGVTATFVRADKEYPSAELHFCAACGSTTHFRLTPAAQEKHGDVVTGVNLRLAEDGDLAGVEVRFPDGAHYAGEGEVPYLRGPVTL